MKKEKGVKKNVVKKDIFNQDYVDCLFEKRKSMHTIQTIQSFKHQLCTIRQNKVSLSPYDDKRYSFQSEPTLYICLNVKELLARNKRDI